MELPEEYATLGEERFPSVLLAVYPEGTARPEPEAVEARLRAAGLDLSEVKAGEPVQQEGVEWTLSAMVRFAGRAEPLEFRLALTPSLGTEMLEVNDLLTAEEMEATRASEWSVSVATKFGAQPLGDFHRQLRVVAALAEDAVTVADALTQAHHSAGWVLDVAASATPPSPKALLRVQCITPEEGSGGSWLHSHGLLRCGLPEVEILDVSPEAAWPLQELLYSIGAFWLRTGLPDPGVKFDVGLSLDFIWLPWHEGLQHVKPGIVGTSPEEREDLHGAPGAMLFTPPAGLLKKRPGNPCKYLSNLSGEPALWVHDDEEARMTQLARERLPRFRALQERHGGGEEWMFGVKIGFPVGDPRYPDQREHLWFQVHAFQGDRVDATAMNDAYHIKGLREGKRGEFSLEGMSDWVIMGEEGVFTPDTIYHLERLAAGTP
ncbi:MAG: DUF4026 domain-containing protein [Armatimonadetes bacterium]|nr:DUF4026 domain-containing protein [Armatimonadota bacterium]